MRLTVEQINALRNCARAAIAETKQAFAENPGANRDKISRPILKRHYEKIKPLGLQFEWLLIYIGRANGILKDPD